MDHDRLVDQVARHELTIATLDGKLASMTERHEKNLVAQKEWFMDLLEAHVDDCDRIKAAMRDATNNLYARENDRIVAIETRLNRIEIKSWTMWGALIVAATLGVIVIERYMATVMIQ